MLVLRSLSRLMSLPLSFFGAMALLGCTVKTLPPGSRVIERLDVHGAHSVDVDKLKKRIATSETKHALYGILEGTPILTVFDAMTVEYRTYDRLVLDRDLQRVRRYYHARGFYDVTVRAGRVVQTKGARVRVSIIVDEGEPVLIEKAELEFANAKDLPVIHAQLSAALAGYANGETKSGEPAPRFDEETYDKIKLVLARVLTNAGYAYGEVEGKASVNLATHRARVRVAASTGPLCHFGPVTIEGLGEIPERPVRAALGLEEGGQFSANKIEAAQFALADLQVFGSVEIAVQRSSPGQQPKATVPIRVIVQPIKLRAARVGVGFEVGSRVETHGVGGWEDRNFIGGLRRFSIDARAGTVFFPLSAATLFSPPDDFRVLPELELKLNFKQPAFPEARTNTLVAASTRLFLPRTLPVPENFDADRDNVVGYREIDGAFGFDRKFRFRFWRGNTIYAAQFIKLRFDDPFSYTLAAPPDGFERVLIPYLDTILNWDFRRNASGRLDPFNPSKGVFLGLNLQFAGGFMQGDADDIRVRPEVRAFIPLGDHVVMAGKWATGYLFPRNYGESLPDPGGASEVARARDLQLLSFRGFFSGGPNSNRGYSFREVGPYEQLAFLSQFSTSTDLQPTGGLGMWELSGELRFLLTEKFIGVLFVDSSDVVRTLSDYRLTHPHISPGFGFRYRLPFGSLRFDFGVRPPYLQKIGSKNLEPEEGGPLNPDDIDSAPFAFHLAIGEAF
jgi:outer membrane protein assembly factor BamA